jgi:uncharacterized protein (TIRG00374 family)
MLQASIQNFKSTMELNSNKIFNKKLIVKGIYVFGFISIGTILGLFLYNNSLDHLNLWKQIDLKYIILCLFCIFNDLYIGAFRNQIFIKNLSPGVPIMVSIKANLANLFMGAVTPSQTGGGPAQWYIWYKNGVSIPAIIATSFYNFISTIIFFPVSAFLAIYCLDSKLPSGIVSIMTKTGFSIFFALLFLVFLALYAASSFNKIIHFISSILVKINPNWKTKLEKRESELVRQIDEHRTKYFELMKNNPMLMVLSLIITFILYFNKYLLAYFICLAFNTHPPFWDIVSIMAITYMLLYFAPSPGGSGIAEVSITALLSPFVTAPIATSVAILHRSFLIFIPAILGGLTILQQLKNDSNKSLK